MLPWWYWSSPVPCQTEPYCTKWWNKAIVNIFNRKGSLFFLSRLDGKCCSWTKWCWLSHVQCLGRGTVFVSDCWGCHEKRGKTLIFLLKSACPRTLNTRGRFKIPVFVSTYFGESCYWFLCIFLLLLFFFFFKKTFIWIFKIWEGWRNNFATHKCIWKLVLSKM